MGQFELLESAIVLLEDIIRLDGDKIDGSLLNRANALIGQNDKQKTQCCDNPNILPYGMYEVMCYNCSTVINKN